LAEQLALHGREQRGGNCNLTPTNGGAFCSYGSPATSFTITTTITGTPPTEVAGQVGYADAGTGTFQALVTAVSSCHCSKLSAEFFGFDEESHRYKLAFFLKWKMHCAVGTIGVCEAGISITRSELPRGLRLRRTPFEDRTTGPTGQPSNWPARPSRVNARPSSLERGSSS
jgi:hypothetical protein